MADGSLLFDTKIDTSGFTKGLDGLKGLASKGLNGISSLASGITKSITAAGAAMGGLGTYASKVGSDFSTAMSQVGATMGMTTEEINNGSEAFEQLKAAAKDAGATTQFSATEAGEALNYLALAGMDADKACATLPGVLNLAAAGGMDLASSSDMVTDSMSALGIEFDDAGKNVEHFSDQLAKTAQKSNTSVAQLGQAILTVGGTAKGLAGGTTELNTALGLLANAGIKGAEGGTALRNVITSLSAPTEKASGLLKTLKVDTLDAEGNMRPLNEVMKDLDASLSGLGEGEKSQILSNIFNKEDLKSVSALMAQSGEAWNNLAAEVSKADGACKDMAETMNDNLQGDLKTMQSALEAFGIEVYESLDAPLRESAQHATESLRNLTDAFKADGFSGLAEALGNELSEWVNTIASYLPQVVDMGVSVINSLVIGMINNLPSLVDSAEDIGISILEGIGEITPRLSDGAVQLIVALCNGLTDNLDKIIEIGSTIVESLWNAICEAAPVIGDTAIELLGKLCDGIEKHLPDLIVSAVEVVGSIAKYIAENLDVIAEAALKIIIALAKGLIAAIPKLLEAGYEVGESLANSIMEIDWVQIGKDVMSLIKQGIEAADSLMDVISENLSANKIADAYQENKKQYSTNGNGSSGSFGGQSDVGGSTLDALAKTTEAMGNVVKDNILKAGENAITSSLVAVNDAVKGTNKEIEQSTKPNNGPRSSVGEDALKSLTDKTSKKKEKEIIDGTARYATLEQNAEKERSTEYLALKEQTAQEELSKQQADLKEKEKLGVKGIQEAYNAWYNAEKSKIEEKQKKIDSVQAKLDKQSQALTIAQQTKDLKGAYKILASLQVELSEDMDEKTKQQKLKDIQNTSREIKQEELDALEEANNAKLDKQKEGLEAEKKLLETHTTAYSKTYSDMVSAYETAYKAIMSKQTKLEDKFKAFGDLYDTFKQKNADGTETEMMKLGDLNDDITQLRTFGEALDLLKQKGASQDFLEEITNMDMSKAMDFTELLLKQTDVGLQNYMSSWDEKNKLAKELAGNFYKDEVDKLKEDFTDQVKDQLGLLPDDAAEKGKLTAKYFVDGLLSKKEEVKAAIASFWEEAGANTLQGAATTLVAGGNLAKQAVAQDTSKDNAVISAINDLAGALSVGQATEQTSVVLDGRKVGESTTVVDGMLRELKRRGVDLVAR